MDDKDKNRNMSVSNDKTENQQPVKNRHFCDKCGEGFTYLSNLKIHKRKHTGEKPYACHLCDKSFIQSFGLKSHLKVHTNERIFHCDKCNKTFKRLNDFTVHSRVHTGEKPYACKSCPKRFKSSYELSSHFLGIHSEKRFKCHRCKSKFAKYSSLKRHARIHAKVRKTLICSQLKTNVKNDNDCILLTPKCEAKSSSVSSSEEKRYECDRCEMRFKTVDNFVIHLRLHFYEKAFTCVNCGKKFQLSSELEQHCRMHTILQ